MRTILGLLLCIGLANPAWSALPASLEGQPLPSLAPMLERVTPAVVNISTRTEIRSEDSPLLSDPFFRWFFDIPQQRQSKRSQRSLGSGVVLDAGRGLVLTNNHVVEKADQIRVTLHDGRRLEAQLIGADAETDIALLRIPSENLQDVSLADSDQLRVGDFVVAIGSPFGLSQTVTSGIVSALGRSGLGIEGYEYFIQTDASINPGNSGGPLVNLRGELVGINTAILAPNGGNVGIGFAIPANMVRQIADQLQRYGEVRRGRIGFSFQNLTPDLAEALNVQPRSGAVIAEVEAGSTAEQAGLLPGDVVSALNGRPISNAAELRMQLAMLSIGDSVDLELVRDGRQSQVVTQIADPFAGYVEGGEISRLLSGALLNEVTDTSALGRLRGIEVGRVSRDSAADQLGLQAGDIMLMINREPISGLASLSKQMRNGVREISLRRGDSIVTLVRR